MAAVRADGQRIPGRETWQSFGTKSAIRVYAGNFEQVIPDSGARSDYVQRTDLSAGVRHIRTRTTGGVYASRFEYVHRDHLGSVDVVTDSAGTPLNDSVSFDPFGGYREQDWTSDISVASMNTLLTNEDERFSRGYTDHEQLNRTGFIHMNGRVYDPRIGRFVSADPIVQAPFHSQSYNRYSYVLNSPVSYTDPSGYFIDTRFGNWDNGLSDSFGMTINFDLSGLNSLFGYVHSLVLVRIPFGPTAYAPIDSGTVFNGYCAMSPALCGAWSFGPNMLVEEVLADIQENPVEYGLIVVDVGLIVFDVLNTPVSPTPDVGIIGAVRVGKTVGTIFGRLKGRLAKTCCFVAGTLVVTESGLRPIEEIVVGDRVLSRDDATGETAFKPVVELIRREQREIYELVLSSDDEVFHFGTTDDHPWRTVDGAWVATTELEPGTKIFTALDEPVVVVSITLTGRTAPTYNLEVADFHTYFVGEQQVWVHNACDPRAAKQDRTSTLEPGPYAKEPIPGHRGRATADEQRQINERMRRNGCHTCGTKEPGTKSGNAIADHQPPQALDEPKIFLPHCNACKARQGGEVLQELRRRGE